MFFFFGKCSTQYLRRSPARVWWAHLRSRSLDVQAKQTTGKGRDTMVSSPTSLLPPDPGSGKGGIGDFLPNKRAADHDAERPVSFASYSSLCRGSRALLAFTALALLLGCGQLQLVGADRPSDYPLRTFNGTGNNRDNPDWGSVGSIQVRACVPRRSTDRWFIFYYSIHCIWAEEKAGGVHIVTDRAVLHLLLRLLLLQPSLLQPWKIYF